jgi:hypothetical protein
MKIVKVSNFNKETMSDQLVATEVSEHYGESIADSLNEQFSGAHAPDWFKLVADDYKLYEFKP